MQLLISSLKCPIPSHKNHPPGKLKHHTKKHGYFVLFTYPDHWN